jgi:hypothetical protein
MIPFPPYIYATTYNGDTWVGEGGGGGLSFEGQIPGPNIP